MGRVQSGYATVAEAAVGADDAGARAGDDRVPPELAGGGVEGAGYGDRLVLTAVSRPGGDVAAEQVAFAQLSDIAAERARQRPSPGLHIANLQPRRSLRHRPDRRRQMTVQGKDKHGRRLVQRFIPLLGGQSVAPLYRLDRVLE